MAATQSRVHEGKLAIVTGSARSIGAAIARKLASKGCNILINYATTSSDALASSLATELTSTYSVKTATVRADISTTEGCEAIITAAKKNFSRDEKLQVDILVHNAAVLYVGPLESVIEKEFHHIYAVNVLGPALLTAACKPYLPTDRSGRIVMMSSINPKIGTPHTTLYSGTKAAMEAMTRVWSRELSENATVNAINPGPVMTDMYLSSAEEVKQGLAVWNPVTPLAAVRDTDSAEVKELGNRLGGRPAYDHEIAGIVAILCDPDAGWSTGGIVSANGGLSFSF
ncbi:L-xylo-3-hexulose reductase [Lachnellula hyalina]|uniref:3-oxoacyl-[acyl-carrier-protein] reductase n=1 Tax=Lachnellula hyalina TaxID=1316788 RepID=A0A8H8R1S0_9HELO|nr:L-xylo-3-hexulose reductase [Lachnellula hyalina]TVY26091.1 L-xylo-3-hexulose reductase [Lachnellula hyalina]